MQLAHFRSLVSHTRLASFIAPGMDALMTPDAEPDCPVSPIVAIHLTHLDVSLDVASTFHSFAHAPKQVSATITAMDKVVSIPLLDIPHLVHLHLVLSGFKDEWWPVLANQLPHLKHLTILDRSKAQEVGSSAASDADANGAVDPLVPSHPCELADTAAALVIPETSNPTVFPNLEHLSFTIQGRCTFRNLRFPCLKHLSLALDHPVSSSSSFVSAYPHFETLQVTSSSCPKQISDMLDLLPAQCRVKLLPVRDTARAYVCKVNTLRMKFAGDDNRHVWRSLLNADAFAEGALKPDRKAEESVKYVFLLIWTPRRWIRGETVTLG